MFLDSLGLLEAFLELFLDCLHHFNENRSKIHHNTEKVDRNGDDPTPFMERGVGNQFEEGYVVDRSGVDDGLIELAFLIKHPRVFEEVASWLADVEWQLFNSSFIVDNSHQLA